MDNVVQYISITDIIPSKFQPSPEEKQKIGELAILIKQFGLLDPILVRPKDGKYEIVLGIDKYEAALLANQTSIPVIIKEVTDEIYSKYKNIENTPDKNTDIINLAELSKIKLEYERDDVKMNNEQLNNNMTNNNFGAPSQGPTFGGRFFPSLEDEPTNMNMMGGTNTQPTPPVTPSLNNNSFNIDNNLIDLTDLSLDKEPTPMPMPNLGTSNFNTQPITPNMDNAPLNNFEVPDFNVNSTTMPSTDNIINIESLQNSNQVSKPVNEPLPSEPVSMDILNADFGPPTPGLMNNNFGYPIGPNPEFTPPMSQNFTDIPNPIQPNFGMPDIAFPNMQQPGPAMINQASMPNFDMNMVPPMQPNFGGIQSSPPIIEANIPTPKDVTPVTNTIKNLAASLETFGYKINITEENLPSSAKIIIEVEK